MLHARAAPLTANVNITFSAGRRSGNFAPDLKRPGFELSNFREHADRNAERPGLRNDKALV